MEAIKDLYFYIAINHCWRLITLVPMLPGKGISGVMSML